MVVMVAYYFRHASHNDSLFHKTICYFSHCRASTATAAGCRAAWPVRTDCRRGLDTWLVHTWSLVDCCSRCYTLNASACAVNNKACVHPNAYWVHRLVNLARHTAVSARLPMPRGVRYIDPIILGLLYYCRCRCC